MILVSTILFSSTLILILEGRGDIELFLRELSLRETLPDTLLDLGLSFLL